MLSPILHIELTLQTLNHLRIYFSLSNFITKAINELRFTFNILQFTIWSILLKIWEKFNSVYQQCIIFFRNTYSVILFCLTILNNFLKFIKISAFQPQHFKFLHKVVINMNRRRWILLIIFYQPIKEKSQSSKGLVTRNERSIWLVWNVVLVVN